MGDVIGQRLRILRARAKLSQAEVGAHLGCVESLVSRWECGNRTPNLLTVVNLARFYGVTTDEILGLAEIRIGAAG